MPEVWRYNLDGFMGFALNDSGYVPISVSRVISGLPHAEIAKRLKDKKGRANMLTFRRTWRQWLQENLHLHT